MGGFNPVAKKLPSTPGTKKTYPTRFREVRKASSTHMRAKHPGLGYGLVPRRVVKLDHFPGLENKKYVWKQDFDPRSPCFLCVRSTRLRVMKMSLSCVTRHRIHGILMTLNSVSAESCTVNRTWRLNLKHHVQKTWKITSSWCRICLPFFNNTLTSSYLISSEKGLRLKPSDADVL